MMIDADTFVAHVAAHAGIPVEDAGEPTRWVFAGLGEFLSGADRSFLAEELPSPLADLLAPKRANAAGERRVIDVMRIPGMPVGHARELVASVCHVLSERLSTSALDRLRDAVPDEVARMLGVPADERHDILHAPERNPSLATGRPGSTRPLSEARPAPGQTGSVVDPNPHAATKLSSTTGTTQERRHDTLAEGTPGYDRSLSGARRS